MRTLSRRQRFLAVAVLVAGAGWAIDAYIGSGPPTVAQAQVQLRPDSPWQSAGLAAPHGVVGSGPAAGNNEDVSELLSRLEAQGTAGLAASELEGLDRDLFQPTRLMQDAFRASGAEESSQLAQQEGQTPRGSGQAAQEDFQARHKLLGVIIGPLPLASVDGRLLPLYAELDGYQLIELRRDYVVFRQVGTEKRVVLKLEQPLAPR